MKIYIFTGFFKIYCTNSERFTLGLRAQECDVRSEGYCIYLALLWSVMPLHITGLFIRFSFVFTTYL